MARITVEDCLQKENNRFALVQLASKRAKQLLNGSKVLLENVDNKSVVAALREIAASKVRFMTPEEAKVAEELEKKRQAEAAERAAQAQAAAAKAIALQHRQAMDAVFADDDDSDDDEAAGEEGVDSAEEGEEAEKPADKEPDKTEEGGAE